MDFGNLLAKILAGGVVGYATNYLAIKMLFEEYFKIKIGQKTASLGGVIVKERKEFERSISRLVESEVIHPKALQTEIQKDNFKNALQGFFVQFLGKELPKVLENSDSLQKIPALGEGLNNLRLNLLKDLEEPLEKILAEVTQKQQAKDIITPQQSQKIGQEVAKILREYLQHDANLPTFFEEILGQLAPQPIADWVEKDTLQILGDNLSDLLKDFHVSLQNNYEEPIKNLLVDAQTHLNLPDLLAKIAQQISEKPLNSLLSAENNAHLPKAISEQLQQIFFKGELSEDIIKNLLHYLFETLKEEKSTIFELLAPDLRENVEDFIRKQLPDLLQTLIPWIQSKKEKLETVVQHAFEDNAGWLTQLLAMVFVGNVGEYISVEEKLTKLIAQQDTKKLAEQATEMLIKYLQTQNIGDLVKKIPVQNVIDSLTPVLLENIQKSILKLKPTVLENVLEKPLKTWFSADYLHKQMSTLVSQLLEKNLQKEFIFSENFTNWLQNQIKLQIPKLSNQTWELFFPKDRHTDLAQQITQNILDWTNEKPELLENWIAKALENYVNRLQLGQLLPNEKAENNAVKAVLQLLDMFAQNQITQLLKRNPADWLEKYATPEQAENITQKAQKFIHDQTPSFTKGRVEAIVQNSLSKQGDTQLRGMVYKAMGKELEPLSWFGAVLGAITGAMLILLPEYQNLGLILLISGLAYGITGWGTNWLAIKMLFKPYYPIKIGFGFNLPFTPGVIAKNKGRFAKSMGRFIGDNLLNKDGLIKNFQEQRPKMTATIKETVAKDDFSVLQNLLLAQQANLADWLVDLIQKNLLNPSILQWQVGDQVEKNKDFSLEKLKIEGFLDMLQGYIKAGNIEQLVTDYLTQKTTQWHTLEMPISTILPSKWVQKLPETLEKRLYKEAQRATQELTPEKIYNWLEKTPLEGRIGYVLEQNVAQLLNDNQEENLKKSLFSFLKNQLQSTEIHAQIVNFLDSYLRREFSTRKPLKDMFDGKLLRGLETNLTMILGNLVTQASKYLSENREQIADKIYKDAYKENIGVAMFKNSIKKTTYSLLDEGIPNFLQKEFESLQEMLSKKIQELGEKPLAVPRLLALEKDVLAEKVQNILKNEKLLDNLQKISNLILTENIFKIPLKDIFKDDAKDILGHLQKILHPEIQQICTHLQERLQDEQARKEVLGDISELLASLLEKHLFSWHIDSVLEKLPKNTLPNIMQKFVQMLQKTPIWTKQKMEIVPNFWEKISKKTLKDVLDIPILKKDLQNSVKILLENPDIQKLLPNSLKNIFENQFSSIIQKLPPDTKNFILENGIEALMQTLEGSLSELLTALDFKGIVEREIEAMHPEQLEGLFYGFARKYFAFLIGYGFIFGIIFGWGIDFGILGILMLFVR